MCVCVSNTKHKYSVSNVKCPCVCVCLCVFQWGGFSSSSLREAASIQPEKVQLLPLCAGAVRPPGPTRGDREDLLRGLCGERQGDLPVCSASCLLTELDSEQSKLRSAFNVSIISGVCSGLLDSDIFIHGCDRVSAMSRTASHRAPGSSFNRLMV